jgi:hypothetical protein
MIQVTEPNNEAVELLEGLLERARNGDIKEILVAGIVDEDDYILVHTDALSYHERLGMLEHLKMLHFESVVEFVGD